MASDNPARSPTPNLESVQAQLDRSFAVANELVASWMRAAPPRQVEVPRETEEQLNEWRQRPPRLGLGAPLPRTLQPQQPSTALTRLKSKLTNGSKRKGRDEELEKDTRQSSDEEESRAKVIGTKKARVAFGPETFKSPGQKKKDVVMTNGHVADAHPSSAPKALGFTASSTIPPSSFYAAAPVKKSKKKTSVPSSIATQPTTGAAVPNGNLHDSPTSATTSSKRKEPAGDASPSTPSPKKKRHIEGTTPRGWHAPMRLPSTSAESVDGSSPEPAGKQIEVLQEASPVTGSNMRSNGTGASDHVGEWHGLGADPSQTPSKKKRNKKKKVKKDVKAVM